MAVRSETISCGACGAPTEVEQFGVFKKCGYCGVTQFLELDRRFSRERNLVLEQRIGEMLNQMAEALGYSVDYGLTTGEDLGFVFFAALGKKRKRIGSLRFYGRKSEGGYYELAAVNAPGEVDTARWVVIEPTMLPDGSFRYETSGGLVDVFQRVIGEADLAATNLTPVWYVLGQMLCRVEPTSIEKLNKALVKREKQEEGV